MPRVIIASGGSCHQFTGGKTEFEVEATTFRQLVRELERNYPGLGNQVEEGMAVAIDGDAVARAVKEHPEGLELLSVICSTDQQCARIYVSQAWRANKSRQ